MSYRRAGRFVARAFARFMSMLLTVVMLATGMSFSSPAAAIAAPGGGAPAGQSRNRPPIAIIGGTVNAFVDTPVVIDGSRSHDTDGAIASYEWDFDDDGVWDLLTALPTCEHIFTTEGRQFIRLRVTDDAGASSVDRRNLHVRLDTWDPVAIVTGPSNASVGEAVTLDGSASYDRNGSLETYTWDFESDGTPDLSTAMPTADHLWPAAGLFTVTLTVLDFAGNGASAECTIAIEAGGDSRPEPPIGLAAVDVPEDQGGAIQLAWTPSTESDVHLYKVYRYTETDPATAMIAEISGSTHVDTGLIDGTLYSYSVSAVDDSGQEGDRSVPASAIPIDNTAPAVPVGLAVTDVPSDQGGALLANWGANAEPDLAGYRLIYRDTVTGQEWTADMPSSGTEFAATGLLNAREYSFTVAAYDAAGNLSASSDAAVCAPTDDLPPSAPVGLEAHDFMADEGGAIALAWALNPETDVAGYTVFRAPVPPGVDPLVAAASALPVAFTDCGTTAWTDENATIGAVYVYFVTAQDASGNVSTASELAVSSSDDDLAPSPPTSITAQDVPDDQGGAVLVTWSPSPSGDVTGYFVRAYDPSGQLVAAVESTGAATIALDGLQTGSEHRLTVSARDAAGNESAALEATATPLDNLAPAIPAGVSASDITPDQGGSIIVGWLENVEPDLAGYEVTCTDEAGHVVASASAGYATGWTFDGLEHDATYSFSVRAEDSHGNMSAASTAVFATARDEIAPDPVEVTAIDHPLDQGGAIDITWIAASAPDTSGYRVYRDGEQIAETTATAWFDPDAGDIERAYTVRAFDTSMNLSDPSDPPALACATDDLAPAIPGIVSAQDAPGDDSGTVDVTVAHVADPDVDGYRVFCYAPAGMLVATAELAALDTVAQVSGLLNGITYRFTALAFDTSGNNSPESAPVWATPLDDLAPAIPQGVLAADVPEDNGGAIQVTWLAAPEADLAGYRVFRDGTQIAETTATVYIDSDLVEGQEHSYAVAAYDYTGNVSAVSEEACAAAVDNINDLPVARASAGPASGLAPLAVAFASVGSYDPDGEITSYAWDILGDGSVEGTATTFSHTFMHRGTYDVLLSVTDDRGATATDTVTISVSSPYPTAMVSAQPEHLTLGETAVLSWTTTDADSVVIEPGIGPVAESGFITVSPVQDTTYTVTATNESGVAVAATHVSVNMRPFAVASIDPTSGVAPLAVIFDGSQSADSDGDITCFAWDFDSDGSTDSTECSGQYSFVDAGSHFAVLTVTDDEGAIDTASVAIEIVHPAPVAVLTSTPDRVMYGQTAVLSWSVEHADSVVIDPAIGPVVAAGTLAVAPTVTTTYTITATGPGGVVTDSTTVNVLNIDPLPESSFGDTYEDLIPLDATIEAYDPYRFSVLTGSVHAEDGSPLAGVAITLLDKPEYGSAVTDTDGAWSLPCDGGASEQVVFDKDGFLTSQRAVEVPWNEALDVEDVVLVAYDQASTVVEFDGDPETAVVHEATTVSDARGDRTATLVFPGDAGAWTTDESGNRVDLDAITVRATEFSTPAAMPAELPDASAFTYCVELSVDEAEHVNFDKPVTMWVEDFIGFGAGAAVPTGYFDRESGEWIAVEDGVAVELIDTDSDGVVDGCDVNSDGIADDLDDDGELVDEVQGLSGDRFVAGAVFWRVEINHFTPYDCNWPWWIPDGMRDFLDDVLVPDCVEEQDCREDGSSTVDVHAGVTHEDLPVAGTGATLHYSSSRTEGHMSAIEIPVTDSEVPAILRGIIVRVRVAGRTFAQHVEPTPNAIARVEWDGLDWRGVQVEGRTRATVDITYLYPMVYARSTSRVRSSTRPNVAGSVVVEGVRSFALPASVIATMTGPIYAPEGGPTANTTRGHEVEITRPVESGQIAEDWTLSVHHAIDPDEPDVVYTGDGRVEEHPSTIASLLHREYDNGGDFAFKDIAVAPDGTVYAVGSYRKLSPGVWKMDPVSGVMTNLAGGTLQDVAVAPDGTVYATGFDPYHVYRIEPDGTKVPVAASGVPGHSYEDGGLALEADLMPTDVAADADGNLYVIATGFDGTTTGYVLFQITPDGRIHLLAGNGTATPEDGVAAAGTSLKPSCVAVGPDGTVYVGAGNFREVWAIDSSGLLTKIGGSLDPAVYALRYSKDFGGTDALDAYLYVSDLCVNANGRVIVASPSPSNLVYEIDSSGVLVTRAGTKNSADAIAQWPAPARRKYMQYPRRAAVNAVGTIFAMTTDGVVRVSTSKYNSPYLEVGDHVVIENESTGHRFAADGRHLETFDPVHGTTVLSFEYDSDERLTGVTDRFGQTLEIERDAGGDAVALVSPDGDRTELQRDAGGRLRGVTYADGATVGMDYSDSGLIGDVTDPRGGVATHAYEPNGRLASSASAEGTSLTYAQSVSTTEGVITTSSNSLTTTTRKNSSDDRGTTRSFINDAGSVTRSWVAADGLSSSVAYQNGTTVTSKNAWDLTFGIPYAASSITRLPSGLTKTTTAARTYEDLTAEGGFTARTDSVTVNGRTSTIRDDVVAGTVRATSPEGRSVLSHYDTDTLLTQSVEASGLAPVTYNYDARGRVTAVAAGERTTSYSYDTSGNVEAITAPDGKSTSFEYDALGRTTTQVRPDNTTVRFDYDAAGNMTTLVTPRDAAHVFDANSKGARTSYDTPESGAYAYAYDAAGRLDEVAMPSGTAIDYGYTHEFLTSVSSGADTIAITRAICGRVEATQRGTERSTFTYDGSLPISETRTGAAPASLAWTYNTDFAPTSFTYAGAAQTYGYDADGLVTSAAPFEIARRADNALPEAVTAPGFALARSYNAYGEIDSADYGAYAFTLTRDASGRITHKAEETSGTARTWEYEYDTLGRLARVTLDGELAESYVYDENGNRTAQCAPLAGIDTTLAASFDAEDRATAVGDATYTYTPDGYLAVKHSEEGTTTFAYSAFGELESVTLADGREVSYTYDAAGRRTSKAIDGTITQRYVWADTTRLLAVMDGAGALEMRLLYADARVPYAADTPAGRIFFAYDQVGSLRVVTDEAGVVLKTVTHDSFGNVIEDSNPALSVPLGFAGGLADSDTGLVLFGARDYDPALGRWIAKDPIGFAGGDANLYGYCLGDPVNLVDPAGLNAAAIGGAFAGALLEPTPIGELLLIFAATGLALNGLLNPPAFPEAEDGAACPATEYPASDREILITTIPAHKSQPLIFTTPQSDYVSPHLHQAGRHTQDQQALVDLANSAKRTGVSEADAEILVGWGAEYDLYSHGPEVHPNRNVNWPHIHVGPVDHIPVR